LWALSFAQIEYRAPHRQVGDVLLNGRKLERPVTGRLNWSVVFHESSTPQPAKLALSGKP